MTTTTTPSTLDRLFDGLRTAPVTRSANRVLGGVCAGVAQRLGIDATVVRIAAVLLGIFGFGVPLYLAAWLLLPTTRGEIVLENALRGGQGGAIALLVITALVLMPTGRRDLGVLALVAAGVWFALRGGRRGSSPQDAPPAR